MGKSSKWVDDPSSFVLRFSSYPEEFGCPSPCRRAEYKVSCRSFNAVIIFKFIIEHDGK